MLCDGYVGSHMLAEPTARKREQKHSKTVEPAVVNCVAVQAFAIPSCKEMPWANCLCRLMKEQPVRANRRIAVMLNNHGFSEDPSKQQRKKTRTD